MSSNADEGLSGRYKSRPHRGDNRYPIEQADGENSAPKNKDGINRPAPPVRVSPVGMLPPQRFRLAYFRAKAVFG